MSTKPGLGVGCRPSAYPSLSRPCRPQSASLIVWPTLIPYLVHDEDAIRYCGRVSRLVRSAGVPVVASFS